MISGAFLGEVKVVATKDEGHPPTFYVTRFIDRFIQISENAPPAIREQAYAYRTAVLGDLIRTANGIVNSERATVVGALRQAGMHEAAAFVASLEKGKI